MLVALLSGCGEAPVQSHSEPVPPVISPSRNLPPEGIQPGETLDVFVMEDESFSGSYVVRSTGHIIVPKLGRVKVGGMSVPSVEKALAQQLENDKLTKATVLVDRVGLGGTPGQPLEPAGTEVFLSGKVNRPGRYTIASIGNSPPTVHQAVLQAGGCSRFAYKKKAYVLRRAGDGRLRRIDADLLAIESGQAKDIPLAAGDTVVVPEKMVDFGL